MDRSEFLSRFLAFQPSTEARMRLFCLPNAGSGVATIYSWLKGLPSTVQVCPIQLPGRENRWQEPPLDHLPTLITDVADALDEMLNTPFALFGYSFGALVAFELARELRRRGRNGCLKLLASARTAPQDIVTTPPVGGLSEAEFISALQTRYNAIPEALLADREMRRLYLPVLRADLEMLERYVYTPEPPLECPIAAFGGTLDASVNRGQLDQWRRQTSSTFAVHMFEGDHFFPKTSRQAFADAIFSECLSLTPKPHASS